MFTCIHCLRSIDLQLKSAKTNNKIKTISRQPGGGGGTLGIIVCGCADGTLAPLAYTRASSAEIY